MSVIDPATEDHLQPTVRGGVALWTLFLGFTLMMVGNGLNLAVLGVRMVAEGFGVQVSGIVMACYFAGFLLGPVMVVRWLSGVGHIRVFASLASTASCVVLVHFLWVSPIGWGLLRFVFGFCMAGLYVVVESWLNDASTARTRGRTLAVYMIASMGGLGLGQLLVATGDPNEPVLFVVASILVSMSFVPVALAATTDAPPVRLAPRMRLREFFATAPTGLVGILFTGASHGILFGLSAVYATRAGYSTSTTAAFLALPSIGALAFQWPIGWVSDRLPRRGVIFVVALAAAGTGGTLAFVPQGSALALPLMFLLGGLTFPLYSLLLSHTLDRSAPGTAMGASGISLRVNGVGAVLGPVVAGAVMGATGEGAFFWCLVVTHGLIATYVAYRLVVEDALPVSRQGPFVPMPARASELAIRLTSRPLRASRERLRRGH
ncbi:MAG TPA: MFS transporter [Ilumatobacteraceae bacterium]|nr:MFS transporter [Ilumatobacteraceae bacterium]